MGRTKLEDALRGRLGPTAPTDNSLGDPIRTCHFDHARRRQTGSTRPGRKWIWQFSGRPRYVVQKRELDFAQHTNERTAGSYLPHNFAGRPVPAESTAKSKSCLASGHCATPGHVPYHQSILIEGGRVRKPASLPISCRRPRTLPLPWIMGYDLEPPRDARDSPPACTSAPRPRSGCSCSRHDPTIVSGPDWEKKGRAVGPCERETDWD